MDKKKKKLEPTASQGKSIPLEALAKVDPTEDLQAVGDVALLIQDVSKLRQLAGSITDLEHQLSDLREEYRRIQQDILPNRMQELGIKKFSLTDGTQLTLQDIIRAKIISLNQIADAPAEERPALTLERNAAYRFLRANKAHDLIRQELLVVLGKDKKPQAKQVAQFCKSLGLPFVLAESVHPQTLSSWVRERMEAGKPVPQDLFHIFEGKQVIVKEKKPV